MKDSSAARKGSWQSALAIGICLALLAVGLGVWAYNQLAADVTNMNDLASWGLYIVCFMFFVGVGTGSMIAATAGRVLGVAWPNGLAKALTWVSVAGTACVLLSIVLDLGQPFSAWRLLASPNFGSPLMWDVLALPTFLLIGIAYLVVQVRHGAGKLSDVALRVWSCVAFAWALLVNCVDSWIFALNAGRGFWNSALMAPWFVASALVCGFGILMVAGLISRRAGLGWFGKADQVRTAKLLGAAVIADVAFYLVELVTFAYSGEGALAAMVLSGQLAPLFWCQMACAAFVVAACLVPRLRTAPVLAVAGAAAVLATFLKRMQLLEGGFALPNLDVFFTTPRFADVAAYVPSLGEWAVALGVTAFGVASVLVGLKCLPLAKGGRD